MPQVSAPPAHGALQPAAAAWFAELRDAICAALEAIEDDGGALQERAPGRFVRTGWARPGWRVAAPWPSCMGACSRKWG